MSLAPRADQDSRSALHWAFFAEHAEIAEFLLQLGVPKNDNQEAGSSPHIAALVDLVKIIKSFWEKVRK